MAADGDFTMKEVMLQIWGDVKALRAEVNQRVDAIEDRQQSEAEKLASISAELKSHIETAGHSATLAAIDALESGQSTIVWRLSGVAAALTAIGWVASQLTK